MRVRLGFSAVLVALVWISIEMVALAAHLATSGDAFPKSAIKAALRQVAHVQDAETEVRSVGDAGVSTKYVEALHPYLGFVGDPDRNPFFYHVSELGFPGGLDDEPFKPKRANDLRVGFFGGSVAYGAGQQARDSLAACLAPLEKNVEVLSFAAGGYKQPQQLHVLADLYANGLELDVVVNLDGFNELALSLVENAEAGVHPLLPRRWNVRVAGVLRPERARLLGRLDYLLSQRQGIARNVLEGKLYRSPLLSFLWRRWDRSQDIAIFEAREAIRKQEVATEEALFQERGPAFRESDVLKMVATSWVGSSRQMHHLAEANGDVYLHFLQPNQYLDGSKPMLAAERSIAFFEDYPYRGAIQIGYPLLRNAGRTLREQDIEFRDLTQIYVDQTQPLYSDACCHMNREGYVLIVEEICEAIREQADRIN